MGDQNGSSTSTFRQRAEAGAYDNLLVGTQDSGLTAVAEILEPPRDAFLESEGRAMAMAVVEGRLDPAAMFEVLPVELQEAGLNPAIDGGLAQTREVMTEDRGWISGQPGTNAAAEIYTRNARAQMVRYLYWIVAHNPWAKNIIRNYTSFTWGEGWKVNFHDAKKAAKWKTVARRTKWKKRIPHRMFHTYLLGEAFTVKVPMTQKMTARDDGHGITATVNLNGRGPSAGQRDLRFLGPEEIQRVIVSGDPDFDKDGIQDAESVLGYLRPDEKTILGADDVVHHKADEFGNFTRGVSILFPALRYLRLAEKFVENRHYLNYVRSRIPLIRKVLGGAGAVAGQKSKFSKVPPPGTVITENKATSWEFPDLKLNAADARHDGDQILQAVSSSVNLPTIMVTSDATNATYSSQFAAESPMVKMFEEFQETWWMDDLVNLVCFLMDCEEGDFDIIPGAVIKRNMKTLVDPLKDLYDRRIISARTFRARTGFDPETEEIQLEKEEADAMRRNPAPLPAPAGGPAPPPAPVGRPPLPGALGEDGQGGRRPRPTET